MDTFFKAVYNSKNLLILIDKSGINWFNCKDTAKILGYSASSRNKAITDFVPDKYKREYSEIDVTKRDYGMRYRSTSKFMNEMGLFRFALTGGYKNTDKNKKEGNTISEDFLEWVTDDLLPKLKQDGFYILNYKIKTMNETFNNDIKSIKSEIKLSKKLLRSYNRIVNEIKRKLDLKDFFSYQQQAKINTNYLEKTQQHTDLLIKLLDEKTNFVVTDNRLKKQLANSIKEINYYKKLTGSYLPANNGYLYIREIVIYENCVEKNGFKFG